MDKDKTENNVGNSVAPEAEAGSEKNENLGAKKPIIPYHPKAGDKIILISAMMQTCIAEFVDEDDRFYVVKNPTLFAAFPERDKENPNIIRTILQSPSVWNRGIMADVNQDQYCIFPKDTYGVMFADDTSNAPLFSTDVNRVYNGSWGKTTEKPAQ